MWARRRIEIAALAAFFILSVVVFSSHFGRLDPEWIVRHSNHHSSPKTTDDGSAPYVRPDPFIWHTPTPTVKYSNSTSAHATPAANQGQTVVLVKLEDEDGAWFEKEFPAWKKETRNVSIDFSNLHHGGGHMDKGRIANEYLTYLIQNYHNLPPTLVFLNTHQEERFKANNVPDFDKTKALNSLNTDTIKKSGFANLRCSSKTGCLDTHLPLRQPADEFRTLEVALSKVWKELFQNENVPEKVAAPCCGEFVVSRDQVKKRSLEDYTRFWEWLNKTPMDDETAGLVFEYLWHIIFGKDAVYCPELEACECDVYGRC